MFWDNYVRLCGDVGKAPNVVAAEIGVKSSGTVTGWKNGAMPRETALLNLANYFGVPVSDLTGEGQKKDPLPDGKGLDAETMELIEFAQTASPAERKIVMDLIDNLKTLRGKP